MRRCLIWALFAAAAWGLLYWSVLPTRFSLAAGEVAPADIASPKDAINKPATEKLRRMAAEGVPEVYYEDPKIAADAERFILQVFSSIKQVRAGRTSLQEAAEMLARTLLLEYDLPVDSDVAMALAASEDSVIARAERAVLSVVSSSFSAGIKPDGVESRKKQVDTELLALNVPRGLHPFLSSLAKSCLRPNLVYDAQETQRRRERAQEAVDPVRLAKGEIIVRRGQRVTEEHIQILKDLGLLRTGSLWREAIGSGLIVVILFGVFFAYLRRFAPMVYADESRLSLLGLVMILVLVLGRAFASFSPYLVPIAAASLILTTLLDEGTALMASLTLSLIAAAMLGQNMTFFFMGAMGSAAAIFAVAHLGRRADLVTAGVRVSFVNAASVAAMLTMGRAVWTEPATWASLGWAGLNGLGCGILALGVIPYVEAAFGVVSPIKLLELANPNHPLLKRLLMEAPGTYHHSIMVANLAEAGTEATGGNSLLARVGAYYHDVGKLKRPYFFIDNQLGMENPHDKLSPTLSAMVITSHVKDGVEIARTYRLPEQVIDFVKTHHGTTLVSYFYTRATDGNGSKVSEQDFRYDGPKPTTRETAIVMLADAVEAAVRSLAKPTPARIENVVKRIFNERLNDGQLDLCDLTLRDMDEVARTFTKMLVGMFHSRIEYYDNKRSESGEQNAKQLADGAVSERGKAGCSG